MTKPEISGIAPFFIVKNVPAALSFYRDRLGFDITFQGPSEDDIFFGIVQRGAAMILLKDVGVKRERLISSSVQVELRVGPLSGVTASMKFPQRVA